ncbi:hypothetical protein [Methylobacterium crusticola]|nr:hypothetical protein [Methylobacterium crusticola]
MTSAISERTTSRSLVATISGEPRIRSGRPRDRPATIGVLPKTAKSV